MRVGPIMLDVAAYELDAVEKEILQHPHVGGVILFTRNYFDQQQLCELVKQIRYFARNDVLIAVDHEGGRVQRFREGFSAIPAMGKFAKESQNITPKMCEQADTLGWLMAAEVLACDIDISFAPVLDIHGISDVIGDRSFHADPKPIVKLAGSFMQGMHRAGMKTTGKHFPGHGNVKEDSHIAMPIDRRAKQDIFDLDMAIFSQLHQQGLLDAVMPAHVIYPDVDDLPAGFSSVWIQKILRQQMDFNGVAFTDDLSMQGAVHLGSFVERAEAAFEAGCDMALVCNHPDAAVEVLDGLSPSFIPSNRCKSMRKSAGIDGQALRRSQAHKDAVMVLNDFYEN